MLSVVNKPITLSIIMLNVVMLSAVVLMQLADKASFNQYNNK